MKDLGQEVLDEVGGQERGRRLRAFDQVICSASFSWKLFFTESYAPRRGSGKPLRYHSLPSPEEK